VNFFQHLSTKDLIRDYVLIIDKSGSMAGSRWKEARDAVKQIAPKVVEADPDGVTLYFFSDGKPAKYENVQTSQQVNDCFERVKPGGSTDLAGVLQAAFDEHFASSRVKAGYPPGHAPTTILCITDGEPNDKESVIKVIIKAANRIREDPELSVSFIQIGTDKDATKFLQKLDDGLEKKGAKFDIVDTLTAEKMKGMSFSDLIRNSIYD